MKPSFPDRWRRFQSRVTAEVTKLTSKPATRKPQTEVARWSGWLRALWPLRTRWPRSRATPRTNSATLRRALRRSIRDELRASGLHTPRAAHDTTH